MRSRRLAALAALLVAVLLPFLASATVTVSPTTSTNGSYTVSWTEFGDRLYLLESKDGAAATRTIVTGLSKAYAGKTPGSYAYQIEIQTYDVETGTYLYTPPRSNVATVVVGAVPGVPGAVSAPASSSTGSYTVSWGAATGTVTRYELYENGALAYSGTALSTSVSGKGNGTYAYRAQACNTFGCSAQTAAAQVVVTLPPGVPGAVNAPATSATSAYTVNWGAATGTVTHYNLYENGAIAFSGLALSASISGKTDGTYAYGAQACNYSGCSALTAPAQVVVTLPKPPGAVPGVTASFQPATTVVRVAWSAATGSVTRYAVVETATPLGGAEASRTVYATSSPLDFGVAADGTYSYVVTAVNDVGAGPASAPASARVTGVSLTKALPDTAVSEPSVPAQGWVGTLPGAPSTDGGAAGYRIDIEVPPGRAGMQPHLALSYSSRGGNGIAGVGWSLSGAGSIYRCPRTVVQDGASRPVRLDAEDRLCMNGQRLVLVSGTYGVSGSQYKTEVDEHSLVTLNGGMGTWGSTFTVQQKSGRVSRFTAQRHAYPAGLTRVPETWQLVGDYDRQGNCVKYEYARRRALGLGEDEEWVLSRVLYTGTGAWDTGTCDAPSPRSVEFEYTDRPDARTTWHAGAASLMTVRLDAIVTRVGPTAVRRYQLAYVVSAATGRSLLQGARLCAGDACGGAQLPETTFSYQEDPPTRFELSQLTTNESLSVDVGADYDGDGHRDLVFVDRSAAPSYTVQLSGCNRSETLGSAFTVEPAETSSWSLADMDMDGRTESLGVGPTGSLQLAKFTCNGTTVATAPLTLGIGNFASGVDYDGDGLIDIRTGGASNRQEVVRRKSVYDLTSWASQQNPIPTAAGSLDWSGARIPAPVSVPAPSTTLLDVPRGERDYDGDGRVDTFFDFPSTSTDRYSRIAFFAGPVVHDDEPYDSYSVQSLGGPGGSFSHPNHSLRRWIDVNGDGLPDIYEPGAPGQAATIYVNRGGPRDSTMFRPVPAVLAPSVPASAPINNPDKRSKYAFVMDIDSDGREELMVPVSRVINHCGSNPGVLQPGENPSFWCGDQFDDIAADDSLDRSVFIWEAYRFQEKPGGLFGTFEMVQVPTNLWAPTKGPIRALADYYGDGMSDGAFQLANQYFTLQDGRVIALGYYTGGYGLGQYLSRNTSSASDLLVEVKNGLGARATWTHQPLSRKAVPAGCDPDPAKPFYLAHHDDPTRGPGYAFFTSSMWTVSKMEVSDGLGGMNPTCYRYEDAMLNTLGRGFQGFKKIIAEERLVPAASEVAGIATGTCGGGGCSANNLRTTTEFFQEFPLTNRVKSVKVERVDGAKLLSETTISWCAPASLLPTYTPAANTVAWSCTPPGPPTASLPTAPGVWVVYPAATVEKKYDLAAGTELARSITLQDQVDLVSGEAARTCSILEDGSRPTSDAFIVTQEDRVFTNDTSTWWLARLSQVTSTQDFRAAAFTAALPAACPALPGSAAAKVRRTTYGWHEANASQGLQRKPLYQATLAGGTGTTEEVRTTFPASTGYDQYGNVLRKDVTARGVTGTLTTTLTHTADGFFPRTETNPVGHISTVETDPATGQPTSKQAVQGGPLTTLEYDALGRLLSSVTVGSPRVYERLAGTVPAACGGAVLTRTRLQAGAPAQTAYLDCLGRALWTETQGFDGAIVLSGEVEYSARGTKVTEYAPRPRVADGTRYATRYSGIDALGRVGHKEVERDVGMFATGKGDALIKTDYTHSGFKTAITVLAGTGTTRRDMTRTYDARGKLRETTQRITTGTARDAASQYTYDPAGSLTSIKNGTLSITGSWLTSGTTSPAATTITATYDHLGRKTKVVDPDRGTWLYTWDGLSRLLTQKDAKLTLLEQEYDGIGRPTFRYTTGSGQARMLDAQWTYDLNGRPGTLSWVEGAGGGTTADFRRDYTYDELWRVEKETSQAGAVDAQQGTGKRSFTVWHAYDQNHGRPKGMRYPGGEVVAYDYGPLGHLLGEREVRDDGAAGRIYRRVKAMSPRGQVTEQVLGNCVTEATEYDASTGMAKFLTALRPTSLAALPADPTTCPVGLVLIRQVQYEHDHFLNLVRQEKNVTGVESSETFTYDELHRLTQAARAWVGVAGETPASDSYTYDDQGNLRSKSDYSTTSPTTPAYVYGTSARTTRNAGPHAVVSVTKAAAAGGGTATFTYDKNGNQTAGDGRTIVFDLMDRVASVTQTASATATAFAYAPDGARYRQVVTGGGETGKFGPKTVYHVDKDYELSVWGGTAEERSYVGGVVVYAKPGVREVRYLHLDRLGSLDAVTADDAAATELLADAHGYDPWGKPRGRDWKSSQARLHPNGDLPAQAVTTDRGFTGHEHLDVHWLIHMNGRVYDYRLGRFLSVDPIIGDPANPQAVNPYSYIGNNPLSGTDPTGYDACPAGGKAADGGCSNAMVEARREGSIAGRGGENVTVNGHDQNSSTGQAIIAAPKSSGAPGQGGKAGCASGTECGGPPAVAQGATKVESASDASGAPEGSRAPGPQGDGRPRPKNQPFDPVPTGPDGQATPPPVPVPGCPECTWVWRPDEKNPRGGRWAPDSKYPTGPYGNPGASWDTGSRGGPGHWDVNHGGKDDPRTHHYPDGRPMPDNVVHPPGWRPQWRAIAVGVGAAGAGYLIYRGVRLAPSLAPPLWWTLPANLTVP